MIIKRTEKEGLIKVIYKSSTILESTYDKENNNLTIIFKNGGQYTYSGVKQTDYTRFEIADSQGKVLNSHIKQYPFTRLENVDAEPILAEINKVENEGNAKITNEMIDSFRKLIESFDNISAVEIRLLDDAEKNLAFYRTQVLKENKQSN